MLPNITPAEAQKMLQGNKARLVDVREPDELATLRVPGAEAAPLSVVAWMNLRPATAELPIIFTCNSGRRTTENGKLLQKLAAGPAWQMEGGVRAWAKQGLPVKKASKLQSLSAGPLCPGKDGSKSKQELKASPLPQMLSIPRQIQIAAGGLVLAGLLGSLAWPGMLWILAFVGVGLTFAGITGFCGLDLLLTAMPWNKR